MTLTTPQVRPSIRVRTLVPSTPTSLRTTRPILCRATEEECARFRQLIERSTCSVDAVTFPQDSPPALRGLELIGSLYNDCPKKIRSLTDGISLHGEQRIFAFELLICFAVHICGYLKNRSQLADPSSKAYLQQIADTWREGIFLAEAGELLARVTRACRPLDAWICGILLAAAGTAKLAVQDRYGKPDAALAYLTPIEHARLLSALGAPQPIAFPDATAGCRGAWNVLSVTTVLANEHRSVAWAERSLLRIPHCDWPKDLKGIIGRRLASLRVDSRRLASQSWNLAQRS